MTESLQADNLIKACKVFFYSEYQIPKKIKSDADNNFISEKFK